MRNPCRRKDNGMIYNGYDDDTLLSIGFSQDEIDRERQAEKRLNAAVLETLHTDWSETIKSCRASIKQLNQALNRLQKELDNRDKLEKEGKKQKLTAKQLLDQAQQRYEAAWKDVLTFQHAYEEDWQEVIHILRAMKKAIDTLQNDSIFDAINHLDIDKIKEAILFIDKDESTKVIAAIQAKIKSLQSMIDWAKSENTTVTRCQKWTNMTIAGFCTGDKMVATKR